MRNLNKKIEGNTIRKRFLKNKSGKKKRKFRIGISLHTEFDFFEGEEYLLNCILVTGPVDIKKSNGSSIHLKKATHFQPTHALIENEWIEIEPEDFQITETIDDLDLENDLRKIDIHYSKVYHNEYHESPSHSIIEF